jgi:hypothetical protein
MATAASTGSGNNRTTSEAPSEPFMLLKPGKKTLSAAQSLPLLLLRRKDAATFTVSLEKHNIRS